MAAGSLGRRKTAPVLTFREARGGARPTGAPPRDLAVSRGRIGTTRQNSAIRCRRLRRREMRRGPDRTPAIPAPSAAGARRRSRSALLPSKTSRRSPADAGSSVGGARRPAGSTSGTGALPLGHATKVYRYTDRPKMPWREAAAASRPAPGAVGRLSLLRSAARPCAARRNGKARKQPVFCASEVSPDPHRRRASPPDPPSVFERRDRMRGAAAAPAASCVAVSVSIH